VFWARQGREVFWGKRQAGIGDLALICNAQIC
jgi:hypothetical protein